MSVLVETSLGDIVVDLEVEKCPRTCDNFLKLCKVKYYGLNAFFNVSKDFIAQTGDPSALGTGGESFASYHHQLQRKPRSTAPSRYFPPEILNSLKHTQKGTLSMAVAPTQPPGCGSQFFFTLKDGIEYLDGKHAVFGHVVEGLEVLDQINDAYVDKEGRPLKDIRIHHIEVLDDPFPDPDEGLVEPPSPVRPRDDPSLRPRIDESESIDPAADGMTAEELEEADRKRQAEASALTLEMIGDLPFAHVRPPENILFVANLNAVTVDEDLELIFSRFGTILSCEVIRDKKSGDSLQYAFIEFDKKEEAEAAYFKMNGVLIDDKRVYVDFSQSVAKIGGVYQVNNRGRGGGRGGRGGSFRGSAGGSGSRGGRSYEGISAAASGGSRGYGMVFDDAPRRERERSRSRDRDRRGERDGHRDDRRSGGDRYERDERRRPRSRSPDDRNRYRERDDRDRDRDRRRHGDERQRERDYRDRR